METFCCALAANRTVDTAAVTVHSSEPVNLTLVVADGPAERRQGLMGYESVPRDGMLFIYQDAAPRTFWMKNTTLPLDIVFMSGNGTVLNVEQADPQPGVPDSDLRRYRSDGAARYVIELQQGAAARYSIRPGTRITVTDRP